MKQATPLQFARIANAHAADSLVRRQIGKAWDGTNLYNVPVH